MESLAGVRVCTTAIRAASLPMLNGRPRICGAHTAMSGHFWHSSAGGALCGQQGMASDMSAISIPVDSAPAIAGAANGPAISPAIMKIASAFRKMSDIVTD